MKFDRWLGQVVYKLAEDHGREVQLEGKVVNFCPSSRQFVLRYADESTEGVSVEEIEDYVPIVRQLSTTQRSPKKRRRTERGAVESTPNGKRTKRVFDSWRDQEPVAPPATTEDKDKLEAIATFVQDVLCPLTSVRNVSDDKQQALLAALDKRNEEVRLNAEKFGVRVVENNDELVVQPLAALARFEGEGGVVAMSDTLTLWATRAREGCGEPDQSTPRRTTLTSPRRTRSPCSQHLSELMTGTRSLRVVFEDYHELQPIVSYA